mmetsp:Transcript_30444/g.64131  ORF Transcript_30444/g.64131 Transcript_30444/m.64131 type:complete len:464 (+) Transcript_30444:1281-2672(+)
MTEMILIDRHAIQNFRVDLLVFDIDQIHLLANALHGRLGTKRRDIRPDESMSLPGNGLGIDVLVQLHVARVNAKDFQTTVLIGDSNVNFAIEASETPQCRIHRVGSVRGSNDDHRGALLQPVHERQHLTDDAAFDLSICLLPLGRNGVDLVDENDGRRVLLRLLERLPQIGLRLPRHFGHDLRPVDEEEEGPRLVGHGPGDERLPTARGAVQEHSPGGLDAQSLEERRVPQRQLDHLPDLGHLLPAAAHVVVAHVVQLLLVLALDGLSLAVDDRVGRHDAVGRRVRLDHLELDGVHRRADQEQVALLDGAVGLQEVRLEVHVEEVARHALDGVVQGQDVDALPVGDVAAVGHGDDVGEADAQVLADDFVHADAGVVARLVGQDDAHGVAPFLALDEDGVAAEEGQLFHFGGGQRDHGVVVVGGVVDEEAVGRPLLAEEGVFHVGVFCFYHFDCLIEARSNDGN